MEVGTRKAAAGWQTKAVRKAYCPGTRGLSWLQNWVIHRDLKPSNILVMGDGPEQVPQPPSLLPSCLSAHA